MQHDEPAAFVSKVDDAIPVGFQFPQRFVTGQRLGTRGAVLQPFYFKACNLV
jgi:hypothetical protein